MRLLPATLSREKYPLLRRRGRSVLWFITVVVSPGDQAVQVGQAVGGGVEEH